MRKAVRGHRLACRQRNSSRGKLRRHGNVRFLVSLPRLLRVSVRAILGGARFCWPLRLPPTACLSRVLLMQGIGMGSDIVRRFPILAAAPRPTELKRHGARPDRGMSIVRAWESWSVCLWRGNLGRERLLSLWCVASPCQCGCREPLPPAAPLRGGQKKPPQLHLRNIASTGSLAAMEQLLVCGQREKERRMAAARAEKFLWLQGANQAFPRWHPRSLTRHRLEVLVQPAGGR